jgi:ABC-type multidrug transport system fused ATPase/permease subunit
MGVVRITASLAFVASSKQLVDIATGQSAVPLKTGIIVFLCILAVQLCTILFVNWWNAFTNVKAQNIMRRSLFETVMKSRWDGRERFLSGDAVNRLEEDIRVVSDLVVERIPVIILTLVQLIAASVYLMMLASTCCGSFSSSPVQWCLAQSSFSASSASSWPPSARGSQRCSSLCRRVSRTGS